MRIVLDFASPEPGAIRQWTVTLIDDQDGQPAIARLTRTQMKRLAGELDEMIHTGGPDWTNPPVNIAEHVGDAHLGPIRIDRDPAG